MHKNRSCARSNCLTSMGEYCALCFSKLAFCDDKTSPSVFMLAICDLKTLPSTDVIENCDEISFHSSFESWNIKSSGKRSILRFTCSFRRKVSTPYNRAKSRSRITCLPRMVRIRLSICSTGWMAAASFYYVALFCHVIISIFQNGNN